MGMFDWVRCKYALPEGAPAEGYQTKDTPNQLLDTYEIREDGTLWGEDYDIEDHSDPNAKGLMRLVGTLTPVNIRPVFQGDFTGEINFYTDGWDFSAYFVKGQLRHLEVLGDGAQRNGGN